MLMENCQGMFNSDSCLLFPISLELCSLSVPDRSKRSGKPLPGLRSKRWDSCIGLPSLAFPYGQRDYLQPSFDIDCLLALWPLLLLISLVTCKAWSFDLYLKKLPCNTVYILTQNSIKHPCSSTLGSPSPSLSLSLSIPADSLEHEGWLRNPGNISRFPSFTFLSLTLDHQVPVH